MATKTPKAPQPPKRKTRRLHIYGRYLVITGFLLFLSTLCIIALINTTVIKKDIWDAKGNKSVTDTISIASRRGDILASDGSLLATNLNYYTVRIDFHASRIDELNYKESLDSLADTLAFYHPFRTRQQWYDRLYAPLKLPKTKRSKSYTILRNISYDELQRLKKFPYFRRHKNPNRTGLVVDPVLLRKYPYGDMARLSIGRVGQTKSNPEIHGISGLEQALDSILFGKPGLAEKVVFPRGTAYWPISDPVDGPTITTTIDITMQDILEHELGEMLVNCKGEWGSAMIMEVATGDIKAISNLDRDTIRGGYIEAMNHIVQAYEPGSVIKVITMLSALEDGYVNLDRVYPIEPKEVGYRYAGGKPIKDTHSPASLPVRRFIEYSSNIGMTKLVTPHYENNLNGFRDRLRQLGFFDRFNTGMARERTPHYPTLDLRTGGRVSLSRMTYGYATLVPPLYTCAVYNAIANDGKFVRPRLVKAIRKANGEDSIIPVSYVRERICSSENARILREMLLSVVWGEGGTAKGLRNNVVKIAGKTGTAGIAIERPRDANGKLILSSIPFKGGYREGKHNRVTFCGFFPYDNPKYTCIVVISDPQAIYGAASTCGTVFRNVALKLHSRGMLDNHSDFTVNPVNSTPTLYGSYNAERASLLCQDLGIENTNVIKTAPKTGTKEAPIIPDLTGLGIREALVQLESMGLIVHFSGTGYVTEISPAPGTPVAPRTHVKVTLSQD